MIWQDKDVCPRGQVTMFELSCWASTKEDALLA